MPSDTYAQRGFVAVSRSLAAGLVPEPPQAPPDPRSLNLSQRLSALEPTIVVVLLAAAVAVRLHVITHFNINWDEFYYLAHVHDGLRGELALKLQTFHVHFFGWLARVSPNEVDQIIAARAVMLSLHLVTAWLLYRLARRLTSAPAARFAAAAYLSVSFVIWTGASFRADPIATCLVMAAFDLLLTRRGSLWRYALAGLVIALAAMITIKTALFLPSLAVMLVGPLLHRPRAAEAARRALATVLTAAAGFALLYGLHALTVDKTISRSSAEVAATSLSKTVTQAGFFPRLEVLVLTLRWDLVFWAFWLVGGAVLAQRIWLTRGSERWRWLEAAALALPVASLAVYRNSFSYFYPLILAPASVLVALAWQALTQGAALRPGRGLPVALKLFAFLWFGGSLVVHGIHIPRLLPLEQQREVLAAVHQAFPAPTPYLDSNSMVASFPQVGFFMSSWGLEAYVQRGEPVLRRAIEDRQPPLLIANHALLDLENAVFPASGRSQPRLLEPDREALSGAYVHHWGPIYVAGKRFQAPQGSEPARINLLIAGRYTLEAHGPISIDDRLIRPGESVELARGGHWVAAVEDAESVTLRWGEGLYRPEQPPPSQSLFLGF